ncbi:hypothetical protein ASG52_14410 [Methylobacterium sp. Leaf456]|uniref:hypothetical protein n=1 Tax=Methylobacterium sp. Leaf456 TaxID=1736382 RepID=UPI0006FF9ECC|nr:hypothetical protein [Methylobacterium sp. Leaf456]KQT45359.1 hypothetical protein ASG52_14410 [Methylobacterium sp. Leaf456]
MTSSSLARRLAAGIGALALSVGVAAAQDAAPPVPEPGKPANLCQELVAFVKQPEPSKQAAATPTQQATAVSNPSGKTEGGKPSDAAGTEKSAGLSGTVTDGAKAEGDKGAAAKSPEAQAAEAKAADAKAAEAKAVEGKLDAKTVNPATDPRARANAEAKAPPAPGTPGPGPKPDQATLEKIEAAAAANDLPACRSAARAMRVAGVVMPPPLLGLSALDLKYSQP